MPGVWEGIQPELQPHHPQPQAHRLQTLWLWPLWEGLPEEGGPQAAPGDTAWAQMRALAGCKQQAITQHYGGQPPHLLSFTSDISGPRSQSEDPSRVSPSTLLPGTARGDKLPLQSSAQSGNQVTYWAVNLPNRLPHTGRKTQKSRGAQIKSWALQFSFPALLHRQENPSGFFPPPDLPQILVWKRRNHHLQGWHVLMFLSRMKNECYFFFSFWGVC